MAMPAAPPPAEGTDAAHAGVTRARRGLREPSAPTDAVPIWLRVQQQGASSTDPAAPVGSSVLGLCLPSKGLAVTWLHLALQPFMLLLNPWLWYGHLPPACRIRAVETSPQRASVGSVKPTHCCF